LENDNKDRNQESLYTKRLRAGKRRTYFFDVRATKGNDYYLTITESRKRFDDNGYDRHKVFVYKEDFNKFLKALNDAIDYVKTDLMPDFNFDAFNHDYDEVENAEHKQSVSFASAPSVGEESPPVEPNDDDEKEILNEPPKDSESDEPLSPTNHEEVDKW
jgi:hypothetical protein